MNRSFHQLLFFMLCFGSMNSAAQSKADSLRALLRRADDTTAVRIYFELATLSKQRSATEEGLAYCDSAHRVYAGLSSSGKIKAKKSEGNVYSIQGIFFSRLGEFTKALEADTLGLRMRIEANDQRGISSSYSNLGILYDNQGDYSRAIDCHFKALKIRERMKDTILIASSLGNIGEVYRGQKEYDKAQDYFQRSLNAVSGTSFKDSKDPLVLQAQANALNNLALLFENKGDYDKSLDYHFRALRIKLVAGDLKSISASYNNIGLAYLKQGKVDSALANHYRSLAIKKQLGDKYGMAASYCNISEASLQKGDLKTALEQMRLCIDMARIIGSLSLLKEAELGLSDIFDAMHQPDSAFRHYKKFIVFRDSIFNVDNARKSLRVEMEYAFQKENERKQLEQEKKDAIAKAEARKQQVILWSTLGGLAIVLVFSVLLFSRFRVIRKQKSIIEIQKNSLEEKQMEIMDSIRYASRIQNALMPNEKNVQRTINRLHKD